MKILIYSTNSNFFNDENYNITSIPTCYSEWTNLANKFPEHEYIIATQLPGMFVMDTKNNDFPQKTEKIRFEIIKYDDEEEIANYLKSFEPDIAFAASFYEKPYDWLTIKDALVAQYLRKLNIKTICHPIDTAVNCFDKWRTNSLLKQIGINHAKAVYVHHNLFINAGNRKEIKSNIYQKSVLAQLKELNFPVIIKDTVGLSSYGMEVVKNFEEAKNYLYSKKNTSDRIIEEFIDGLQFGTEIHGTNNNYEIFDPFLFSVNKYGITSPKQSVKIGPVTNEKYKIKELKTILHKLATTLNLQGITQVDLVFSNNKWYILEINPRISGMSTTYSVASNKTLYEMFYDIIQREINCKKESNTQNKLNFTLNIKFPILNKEELKKMSSLPFVKYIYQIENLNASQKREIGYCEIIISTNKDLITLENQIDTLKEIFPNVMENIFFENAKKLIKFL